MNKQARLLAGLILIAAIIVAVVVIHASRERETPVEVARPARTVKITPPEPRKEKPVEIAKTVAAADTATERPAAKEVEESGTISGIVTDITGKHIENAALMTIAYRAQNSETHMGNSGNPNDETDSRGAFEITELKTEGRYDIEVTADGYAKVIERNVSVGSRDVVIKLPREGMLSGTVFHEGTQQPLAAISVRLAYPSASRHDPYIESRTTTDTDGHYAFYGLGPSEDYLIEASGKSLISDPVYLELEEAERKEGFDLSLYPALSVSGRTVLTGTDTAAVGVGLQIRMSGSRGLNYGTYASVISDSEGLFAFSGLREGEYRIGTDHRAKYRMQLNEHGYEEPLKITLNKNELPEQLLVEVGIGRTILGTVTDEAGRPIQSVQVRTQKTGQPPYRSNWTGHGRTEEEGKYQVSGLDPQATEFKVHFEHQRYVDVITTIEFEEDEHEKVLDMELGKGLSISGYVTDSDSAPAKGAKINASYHKRSDNARFSKSAASDTEGYFEIVGITNGKWRLKAEKSGYVPAELRGVAVEDENVAGIELVLARGHSISGTMFLGDGLLTNQRVNFSIRSGLRPINQNTTTDEEGRFTISELEQGTYTITATIWNIEDMPDGAHLRQEVENVATGTEDLVIRFGGLGSISGVVKNAATFEPVTDFEVAYQEDDEERAYYSRRDRTEIAGAYDGAFTVENIQAGTYKLEIKAAGYSPKIIENVEVLTDQTTGGIEVLLAVGSQITGRVIRGDTGGPVENASIHIDGEDRNRTQTSTDKEGVFTIASVAPGKTYTLQVRHSDYPSKKVESIETFEGETTYLDDITLSIGGIIEGRVSDGNGNAIEGVRVSTMFSGFDYKQGETDEDGHYTITGVALGEVTVVCNVSEEDYVGASILTKTANTVEGVPVTVDFVFGAGYTISGTVTDNGNPITTGFVMLYARGDGQTAQSIGMARLEESSDFNIEDIKPGEYLLTVMGIDENAQQRGMPSFTYQHKQKIDVAHQDLTLDIKTYNSTVSGRVVDEQGDPAKQPKMVLFEPLDIDFGYGDDKQLWQLKYLFAPVDKDGKFSLGSITPGRYKVGTNASQFEADFQPIKEINVIEGMDIKDLVVTVPEGENDQ